MILRNWPRETKTKANKHTIKRGGGGLKTKKGGADLRKEKKTTGGLEKKTHTHRHKQINKTRKRRVDWRKNSIKKQLAKNYHKKHDQNEG